MDHTHKTTVVRRKHRTMVYMKYGHVSSYWSSPAVGTRRVWRVAWRTSLVLSLVAIPESSLPLHPHDEPSIPTEYASYFGVYIPRITIATYAPEMDSNKSCQHNGEGNTVQDIKT